MLPYFLPEIVPLVLEPKIYRFGFDEKDKEGNIRAIIESQLLSMRLHSQWTGEKPEVIYATGGASKDDAILQTIADIFNVEVFQFETGASAALGAALRAVKTFSYLIGKELSWLEVVRDFTYSKGIKIIPRNEYKRLYDDMLLLYKEYVNPSPDGTSEDCPIEPEEVDGPYSQTLSASLTNEPIEPPLTLVPLCQTCNAPLIIKLRFPSCPMFKSSA